MALSKVALKDELLRALEHQLDTRTRAHRDAREGATHDEARPENDKDTRAIEASYLARGQAMRAEELREHVVRVGTMSVEAFAPSSPIAVGALVTAEEEGEARVVFVAPHGGGLMLGSGVRVVTPASPLGRNLIGRMKGESFELRAAGRVREWVIVDVE